MSDEHKHSHPEGSEGDHKHDHHHDHEHDHHDHDHGHTPEPEVSDDSSSRALGDALQGGFRIIQVLVVVLAVVFVGSCFKTVKPNEVAVILRFGKPVGKELVRKQGLHFAWPFPIDEVVRIPVGESRTVQSSVGWHQFTEAEVAGGAYKGRTASLRPGVDGYTLTGDHNILHVRATVKYRIEDPVSYLFDFQDPQALLLNIVDNAIVYASSQLSADEALYGRGSPITEAVKRRIQEQTRAAGLKIAIETLDVERQAPLAVRPEFERVQQSEQERSRNISRAQAEARQILLTASADSNAVVNAGITRSNRLVQAISADAEYFKEVLPYYKRNPELFEQRVRNEKLQVVFTNSQNIFYIPTRADGKERELRININRTIDKPQKEASAPPPR